MDGLSLQTRWRNPASKRIDVVSSHDPSVVILNTDVDSHALYSVLRHCSVDLCFIRPGHRSCNFSSLIHSNASNSGSVLQVLENVVSSDELPNYRTNTTESLNGGALYKAGQRCVH